jgi:K+-transporting ATPase KdpF subunit
MNLEAIYGFAGMCALALLAYLIYALIWAEDF